MHLHTPYRPARRPEKPGNPLTIRLRQGYGGQAKVNTMKTDNPIMFDKDVAEFLGISMRTLQRRVKNPVAGEIDLNKAEPQIIGNRRLWLRVNVERLVGIRK